MFRIKKKNTGKQYEELVEYVYKQLSDFSGKKITVERNIKIKGQKEDFTGLRFFNGGWKRDFWGNFPSKDEIEAYIKLKNGKR